MIDKNIDKYIKLCYFHSNNKRRIKMKKNEKDSGFGDKVSETLRPLVENIKKAASDGKTKKFGALLALLIAGGVAKVSAEEIIGTIMFGPDKNIGGSGDPFYTYMVDSTGNSLANRRLIAMRDGYKSNIVFDMLTEYLKPGQKFVFESNGKSDFETIYIDEIIALVMPDGQPIELTQMFSPNDIKQYLASLYRKLVREGRAK
jgi:hypothetical protein